MVVVYVIFAVLLYALSTLNANANAWKDTTHAIMSDDDGGGVPLCCQHASLGSE